MDGHSGYSDTQTVGLQGLSIRQPRSSTEGAGARTTVALGARLAGAPEAITSEAIEAAEGGQGGVSACADWDLPATPDEVHTHRAAVHTPNWGWPRAHAGAPCPQLSSGAISVAGPFVRASRCPSEAALRMAIGDGVELNWIKKSVTGLSLQSPIARRFFNQLSIDAGRDPGRV